METMKNNKERAGHLGSARSVWDARMRETRTIGKPAGRGLAVARFEAWPAYPCGTCGSTDERHDRGACAVEANGLSAVSVHGESYGYLDRHGRIRCLTVSRSDAVRNARLNGSDRIAVVRTVGGRVPAMGAEVLRIEEIR